MDNASAKYLPSAISIALKIEGVPDDVRESTAELYAAKIEGFAEGFKIGKEYISKVPEQ